MEAFKEVASLLGTVLGLVTALLSLFAYLADRRQRSRTTSERNADALNVMPETRFPTTTTADHFGAIPPPIADAGAFDRARQAVRRPACVMLAVGSLGLVTNLFIAGVGFVDEFVTPLGIQARMNGPMGARGEPSIAAFANEPYAPPRDESSTTLGLIAIFGFAVASAVSIVGAYSMLKLRNYWLAMAGSVAIMPASVLCCFVGGPLGVWSIVVLFKPEVVSAFR